MTDHGRYNYYRYNRDSNSFIPDPEPPERSNVGLIFLTTIVVIAIIWSLSGCSTPSPTQTGIPLRRYLEMLDDTTTYSMTTRQRIYQDMVKEHDPNHLIKGPFPKT